MLVHENPTHPLVNLRCLVSAGSAEDTPAQAGLASFTGSGLLRGTEHYPFEHLNEVIDSAGMSLRTHAGRDLATISARCLSEDLPLALDLISEVLCRPTFPQDEVTKLQHQLLTRIRQAQHNTRAVVGRLFREAAYPVGHPYRLPPNGEEESVRALTRDDLAACHRTRYGPRRTCIVVSGMSGRQSYATFWPPAWTTGTRRLLRPRRSPTLPTPRPQRPSKRCPARRRAISSSAPWPSAAAIPSGRRCARPPSFSVSWVCPGRLGATVRDEQGLAYGVHAGLDAATTRTAWTVRAGVNPANVDRALTSIRSELTKLRDTGVTDEELAGVQRYLIGSMALQLETNAGITSLMQQIEFFDLGLDYVEQRPALVQAVTHDAILDAVRHHLPSGDAITAIAGPARPSG